MERPSGRVVFFIVENAAVAKAINCRPIQKYIQVQQVLIVNFSGFIMWLVSAAKFIVKCRPALIANISGSAFIPYRLSILNSSLSPLLFKPST
jgi:hypothetical protein